MEKTQKVMALCGTEMFQVLHLRRHVRRLGEPKKGVEGLSGPRVRVACPL